MKNCTEENRALLDRAICFAVERHSGATRKGSDTPYILHPLEVVQILASMNADIDLLIAGVLHDTVEDTDTSIEEIYSLFGEDVGALVASHTEDKTKSWLERKQHDIEQVRHGSRRLKMLVLADKVANLRSLVTDFRREGKSVWDKFNAPMNKQAWLYSELQDVLLDLARDEDTEKVYWELVMLYKELFITYLIDEENEAIYQIDVNGECWRISRREPEWVLDRNPLNTPRVLPNHVACRIIDNWSDGWKQS